MLLLKFVLTSLLHFSIICQAIETDVATTKMNVSSVEGHEYLTVPEKWESMEKKVKNLVKEGIKMALPMLMEKSGKLNLSNECIKSSLHLISGLKELKPWAFEFLDSSGKFFDGMLVASISSFGHYDQCLAIKVKSTKLRNKGELLYGGQYCMVDIKPPLPPRPQVLKVGIPDVLQNFSQRDTIFTKSLKFIGALYDSSMRIGICIPSKCSQNDLSKIVSLLGSEVHLNTSVYRCELNEENEFTPASIAVIFCYCLIGGLVLVATIFDAFVYNTDNSPKSKALQVLLAFSFYTNFKKFSATDASKSRNLRCLSGLRFLGMLWVITLHTYIECFEVNLHGYLLALEEVKKFKMQVISNGSLSVDSFFFMGGFLVCYLTMKVCKDQKQKFNAVLFIIYRLLRILPVYVVILMFSSLIHMLGSGPVWHSKAYSYYQPCYKNWWTNLLFINNFYDTKNACFPTTWYVATDFQLYIYSLVIIIPLLRWPKIGISVGILTIIASTIYAGIETYIKEYPPAIGFFLFDINGILDYLRNFNFKPYVHASPYAIGLLSGYLLAIKPKIKITPFFLILGWSLALTLFFTLIFGTADWYKNLEAPFVPSIIYASVKRTAWALAVAWMIICCATGYGGIINYILSMDVFVPLGRLTFLAYLIHPIVQMLVHGTLRTRVPVSHTFATYSTLGHTCISYAVAFIVYMLVEVPFANLVQILISGASKKEEACNKEKDDNYLETNINADKKEDVIVVTFFSEGKSNGIDGNIVANNS